LECRLSFLLVITDCTKIDNCLKDLWAHLIYTLQVAKADCQVLEVSFSLKHQAELHTKSICLQQS